MLCLLLVLPVRLLMAADAIPGEEFCDGAIDELRFRGNERTQDFVLWREMHIGVGQPCSLDAIVDSTQSIMNLRLFNQVWPVLTREKDALVLTYEVKEKIYFLPLPRFSRTSDGEIRYGAQLRWDNFSGRHHRLKLTTELRHADEGRGQRGRLLRADYQVPRFFGTNTGLSLRAEHFTRETTLVRDDAIYGESDARTNKLSLIFSRWLTRRGAQRGMSIQGGFTWQTRSHDLMRGSLGPFEEGQDLFFTVGFTNRKEQDDLYRLQGSNLSWSLNIGSTSLGSDYSHYSTLASYVRYLPVDQGGLKNLNYRVQVGYSNGAPFGEQRYSLGGGDLHRGLKPGSHHGDILTLVNVEYLTALDRHPQFRWVVFGDLGNVHARGELDLLDQKPGVGVGIRYKLLKISNTDIRVDLAYGRELEKPRFYVSTDLTF